MKESYLFLKKDGGFFRFYRGFLPAVLKSGIGRTSDITIYTHVTKNTITINIFPHCYGSLSALVKIAILPLDTLSNVYQVHGKDGYKHVRGNLYRGALAYGAIHCISGSSWLLFLFPY